MTHWTAEITVILYDNDAMELHAATGIEPPRTIFGAPATPTGSVTVRVVADTPEEGFRQALLAASSLVDER